MTPTMEDVAGWLRERATQLYNKSKRLDNEFGQRDATLKRAECWFDRATQVEAMGWRPIEECPKDGTFVDLWNGSSGKRLTDCRWDGNNRLVRWDENAFGVMAWCVIKGKLTHFMLQPQPPVKK